MFPLRIHCWGGLGSQFFALSTFLLLSKKFPNRKLVLVLHSGGVTERTSEIDGFLPIGNIKKVSDFNAKKSRTIESLESSQNLSIKGLLKLLAYRSGFVSDLSGSIKELKPWILSVRGHYTNLKIPHDCINELVCISGVENFHGNGEPNSINSLSIHYRIGDLLNVKPESLVSKETLVDLVNALKKVNSIDKIHLYSDSLVLASQYLEICGLTIECHDEDTLSAVKALSHASTFIGTNSKVSLWIVIFRIFFNIRMKSYIPAAMLPQLVAVTDLSEAQLIESFVKLY